MQKLTRRHVVATLAGSSLLLCPGVLAAQAADFGGAQVPGDRPVNQAQTMELAAGASQIDITGLQPGEVAVISRPTTDEKYGRLNMIQHIAVHRRTTAQISAAGPLGEGQSDPAYYVANLVCPHRGFAVSMTTDPNRPFACSKQGDRHGSIFDAAGNGVAGASKGKSLSVPDHTLTFSGDGAVVLTLT